MRTARTNAIAGALVFFELLAPKAMAEEPLNITTLDLKKCKYVGGWPSCPLMVPPLNTAAVYVVVPKEVFEGLKKSQPPTTNDIETIKKSLEATPAPDSIK